MVLNKQKSCLKQARFRLDRQKNFRKIKFGDSYWGNQTRANYPAQGPCLDGIKAPLCLLQSLPRSLAWKTLSRKAYRRVTQGGFQSGRGPRRHQLHFQELGYPNKNPGSNVFTYIEKEIIGFSVWGLGSLVQVPVRPRGNF